MECLIVKDKLFPENKNGIVLPDLKNINNSNNHFNNFESINIKKPFTSKKMNLRSISTDKAKFQHNINLYIITNDHADFDPKKFRRPEIYFGFVHDQYLMPHILYGKTKNDKVKKESEKNKTNEIWKSKKSSDERWSKKSILNRINSNENLYSNINNEIEEKLDSDVEIENFNKIFDSKFISKLTKNIKNKQKMMKKIYLLINTSPNNDNKGTKLYLFRAYYSRTSVNSKIDKGAEQTIKNKEIKLNKKFWTKNQN